MRKKENGELLLNRCTGSLIGVEAERLWGWMMMVITAQ